MYLQGMGTLKITKILNEEKIPSPAKYIKSKRYENCNFKWTKASVYRILSNEIYIGTVVGGKSYKVNHKLKTRIITPKEKRIYVENMHEPLIDKTTFHLVQTKLHEPIEIDKHIILIKSLYIVVYVEQKQQWRQEREN